MKAQQLAQLELAKARSATFSFGPVIERVIQARETRTNLFLDLDASRLLTPPASITEMLAKDDERWQGLGIASETRPYQYVAWLKQSGADLMLHGEEVLGFDGYFVMAHGTNSTDWDNWEGITPAQTLYVGQYLAWSRRYSKNTQLKEDPPGGVDGAPTTMRSAAQRDSRESGAPVVNVLTREQSVTYYFRTREGSSGLLQIVAFTDNPRGVRVRYKLVAPSPRIEGESPSKNSSAGRADDSRELSQARAALGELRKQYPDNHPGVQALLEKIKKLEGR
jgi:hypothetical protein